MSGRAEYQTSQPRSGPGQLFKRLDHWLRVNHPLVWRSRVHYFLVFSLVLGTPFFYFLGSLLPVNLADVMPVASVFGIVYLFLALIIGVFGLWVYWQLRVPINEQSFKSNFVLWGLGAIGMLCLYVNAASFFQPLLKNTATVIANDALAADMALGQQYNFWHCDPSLTDNRLEREKPMLIPLLEKYGLFPPGTELTLFQEPAGNTFLEDEGTVDPSKDKVYFCADLSVCVLAFVPPADEDNIAPDDLPDISTPAGLQLRQKMEAIQVAKQYVGASAGVYKRVFSGSSGLVFSLLLSALGLLLTYPRYALRRGFAGRFQGVASPLSHWSYKRLVAKLDHYFLTNYPILWTTQFHTNVIRSIWISGLLLGFYFLLPFDLASYLNELLNSVIVFLLFVFIALLLLSFYWLKQQSKTRVVPDRIPANLLLVFSYFLLVNLIPIISLFVWTTLASNVDETVLLITFFVSVPIVATAYTAKFFPKWRNMLFNFLGFSFVLSLQFLLRPIGDSTSIYLHVFSLSIIVGAFVLFLLFNKTDFLAHTRLQHFLLVFYLSGFLSVGTSLSILANQSSLLEGINFTYDRFGGRFAMLIFFGTLIGVISTLYYWPAIAVLLRLKSSPKA